MTRRTLWTILTVLMLAALWGCQESTDTPTTVTDDPGLISGEIPVSGNFEMIIPAGGPDPVPLPGPFVIRGTNLRYDTEGEALVVDLTVTNRGGVAYPEPVTLTFVDLIPDGVEVINPDNDVHGPGAAIVFEFDNDDNMWTPGELSLPREVRFKVAPETPIGFYARLNLGGGPRSGMISGRAWEDLNMNGEMEPDEPGLPGVRMRLEGDFDIFGCADCVPEAKTDSTGHFKFTGLAVGAYVVHAQPRVWREPSTPTEMHVLLVETTTGVSHFDQADFGFSQPAPQFPLVLPVSRDAVVRTDVDSRRNDNYGCNPILDVGGSRGGGGVPFGGPDGIRTLLAFDFPPDQPRPELNSVVSARLEMTIVQYQEGFGQSYQLDLHRIVPSGERTPWVEGNGNEMLETAGTDSSACVWVDSAYGVAWTGADQGGDLNNMSQPDFDPVPVATTMIHQNSMGPSAVVSWDVTDVVNGWLRGDYPNLGLVLRDPTSDGEHFKSVWFHSREGERLGQGPGPRLVLELGD